MRYLIIFLMVFSSFVYSIDIPTDRCETITLSPSQVQSIWDNYLQAGIRPSKIISGSDPNSVGANPEINEVDKEQGVGLSIQLPNKSVPVTSDNANLNEVCTGDFSYAVVLQDTLRVGRCLGDEIKNCSVNTSGLKFRNSSDGFQTIVNSFSDAIDFVPSSVSDYFGSEDNNSSDKIELIPEARSYSDDVSSIVNDYVSEDSYLYNDLSLKKVQRVEGVYIKNVVESNSFFGEFQSVCSGIDAYQRCRVVLLSHFDKYFNSYYSSIAVGTTFGPLISGWGQKAFDGLAKGKYTSKVFGPAQDIISDSSKFVDDKLKLLFDKDMARLTTSVSRNLDNYSFAQRNSLTDMMKKKPHDVEGAMSTFIKDFENDAPKARKLYSHLVETKQIAGNAKTHASSFKDAPDQLLAYHKTASSNDVKNIFGDVIREFDGGSGAKYKDYVIETIDSTTSIKTITPVNKLKSDKLDDLLKSSKLDTSLKKTGFNKISATPADKAGLEAFAAADDSKFVFVDGDYLPLNKSTIDSITKRKALGPYDLYDSGSSAPLNPNDLSQFKNDYTNDFKKFLEDGFSDREKTLGVMSDVVKNSKAFPPYYANILNQALYNKNSFFGSSEVRRTISSIPLSWGYWQFKTSDLPIVKAYFVGHDEFTNVRMTLGSESIYNDAYMDIFVKESVDNGDVFSNLLQTVAEIIEETRIVQGIQDQVGLISREDVLDVAYYSTTKNNCPNCVVSYSRNGSFAMVNSETFNDSRNYILELTDESTLKFKGSSVAAFMHHMNLELIDRDGQVAKKDLQSAIMNKETCIDKAKNVNFPLISSITNLSYFSEHPERIGLATGVIDSTSGFAIGFGATMLGTAAPAVALIGGSLAISYILNMNVVSELDGCIDTEDGYYVHFTYRPVSSSEPKTNTISSLISAGESAQKDVVSDKFTQAMNSISESLNNLVESSDKEFVQIFFETSGKAQSQVEANSLFLKWTSGGSRCALNSFDKESKITLEDGNNSVLIDKELGTISINSKSILESALVRGLTKNYRVGAYELPQSMTFVPASGLEDFFEISPTGDIRILSNSIYDCIIEGIFNQTGKRTSDSSITPIFGRVQSLSTDIGGSAMVSGQDIVLSGGNIARERVTQSIFVNSDSDVVFKPQVNIGNLTAINLERGSIFYDKEFDVFILWVRELASINGSSVNGLKADLVTTTNPENQCEEIGVDLSVIPNDLDFEAVRDAENMNNSLRKIGPTQYFETPTKTFYFYSKLDESGDCKKYMKVVDKATGQILTDQEISSFEKTLNGFNVQTSDGNKHQFEFSSEGGQPLLSYNGEKAPLLLAQGRNGSFYYDPKTKNWYVDNSQMLPLNDNFREQGERTIGNVSEPGSNPLYESSNTAGKSGSFDIPIFGIDERILFTLLALLSSLAILYTTKPFEKA